MAEIERKVATTLLNSISAAYQKRCAGIFVFILGIWIICGAAHAGERESTEASEYLNRSHVFFDVQRRSSSGSGLCVIGKEPGKEVFRAQVPDSAFSTFSSFTGITIGNFNLRRLHGDLNLRYRSAENRESFDLLIKRNGDVSMLETDETYTGWDTRKTYGIKTFGALENRGSQAFYFLVTSAKAFHNFGTIQSYTARFFNDYLFNSGVIQLGEVPTRIADLSITLQTNNTAQPNFKRHTVENYGTFRSNRKVQVKDGLHYHEHGVSDFENLEMSRGDIHVQNGSIGVQDTITGSVGNIGVGRNSALFAGRIGFSDVNDLRIGSQGVFHSPNSFNLNVNGSYLNARELTSGVDLTLHLKNIPTSRQPGVVCARGRLKYSFERKDRPRNSTGAPDMTKDPACRRYLMSHPKIDLNGDAFKRLQEDFYRRAGYIPERDEANEDAQLALIPLLAKRIKQTIYTDHYLNTITYHYTTTIRPNGGSSTSLTNVTETGYIWQRRTQEIREFTLTIPAALDRMLEQRSQRIPGFRNSQRARTRLAEMLSSGSAAQRKAEMNRRFWQALMKAMQGPGAGTGAGTSAADPDVLAILGDPYFNALMQWDNLQEAQRSQVVRERPEAPDLAEIIDDARYDARDLTRWLDSNAQRFIDDVAIPLSALTTIYPPARAGALAYQGVRAAVAVAPRLRLVAVALGAGVAAGYDKITTFFSENFSGGKDKGKSDASADRVRSTQRDADRYLKGLTDKGVLGKKLQTKDGYEYYEFTQKTNYNGVRFRKGDYISRDTLHHEWEWFRGKDYHKGAIESKSGKFNIKKRDPGRVLKTK